MAFVNVINKNGRITVFSTLEALENTIITNQVELDNFVVLNARDAVNKRVISTFIERLKVGRVQLEQQILKEQIQTEEVITQPVILPTIPTLDKPQNNTLRNLLLIGGVILLLA